jgi:hypothetical protein
VSVNKYRPFVYVLPEDDANRQLANGFHLAIGGTRQMQVLPVAGGWTEVLKLFNSEHAVAMTSNNQHFIVLLIDFDGRDDRIVEAKKAVPDHLLDRVFVLGAWSQPEALRAALGRYEDIGRALADDCREETDATWGTISYTTMPLSLNVHASIFARSCSS